MRQPQNLVSTREAMEILGYRNPSSVARLVYEHKLKPVAQMGGRGGSYVFDRADIEQLAAARTAEATTQDRAEVQPAAEARVEAAS